MLLSTDFRAMARDALRGKWRSAALIGLLAGLLGASISGDFSINLDSRYGTELKTFFQSIAQQRIAVICKEFTRNKQSPPTLIFV